MGRPKKVVVADESTDVENVETVEESIEQESSVEVESKPTEVKKGAAKDEYSLYAWFPYVDADGFKVKSEYNSTGATVAELLANLEFPAGVNRLVNMTVTHNGKSFERAVAPQNARAMLERKDAFVFNSLFRGI